VTKVVTCFRYLPTSEFFLSFSIFLLSSNDTAISSDSNLRLLMVGRIGKVVEGNDPCIRSDVQESEKLREITKILRDDSCFSGRYFNVDFRNLKPRSTPFCMSRQSIMYVSIRNGTPDQSGLLTQSQDITCTSTDLHVS